MKLVAKLLCAAALTLFLCLAASAREVVIYENNFDDASALSDFTVRVDESYKAQERLLTILGDVMVGGNLVVDKGVVVATVPKAGG